jgi:hypothetical protein
MTAPFSFILSSFGDGCGGSDKAGRV